MSKDSVMVKCLFVCVMLMGCQVLHAQEKKYSTYYYQKATLYEVLPIAPTDIVFVGNSITDGGEWSELFEDSRMKNRGISGDIAEGVYDRLEPILKGQPAKIFLLIGINDVARGTSADTIVARILKIAEKIDKDSPNTKLYIQSVLPVNDCYGLFKGHTSRGDVVLEINRLLKEKAVEKQFTYIDLHSHFRNEEDGKMNPEYSNDGLHLLGKGYLLWREILLPYINE